MMMLYVAGCQGAWVWLHKIERDSMKALQVGISYNLD